MGFFDKIGKAFKDAGKDIGKGIKKAAEWVGDKADDVAAGAGKVAGTMAKTVGLGEYAPAIERSVKGIVKVVTPIGAVSSLDDIVEKGLIDGVISSQMDNVQDVGGGIVRAVGGEKAEKKFDKVVDEKVQPIAETVVGSVARVGLACVPVVGPAILAADAVSQTAALGIKAANGEKVTAMDGIGVAASLIPMGGAVAKGAVSAAKVATKSGVKSADDVAKGTAKVAAKSGDDVAKGTATHITKTAKDATVTPPPTMSQIVKEGVTDGVVEHAQGEVINKVHTKIAETKEKQKTASGFDTTDTSPSIPGGQAIPIVGASSNTSFTLPNTAV